MCIIIKRFVIIIGHTDCMISRFIDLCILATHTNNNNHHLNELDSLQLLFRDLHVQIDCSASYGNVASHYDIFSNSL